MRNRPLLINHEQELPRGHPECLTGKTFVITGVLESMWRDDATDLIKRHSGRVTTSVSGKTTFLLSGDQAGKGKTAQVGHSCDAKKPVVFLTSLLCFPQCVS